MPSINELSVSTYRSIPRTKTNLVRGDFGWPVSTDGLYRWGLKIIQIYERYDGANKVQIEQC